MRFFQMTEKHSIRQWAVNDDGSVAVRHGVRGLPSSPAWTEWEQCPELSIADFEDGQAVEITKDTER